MRLSLSAVTNLVMKDLENKMSTKLTFITICCKRYVHDDITCIPKK